jgi:sugar porter (SP) family MFS transporter
MIPARVLSRFLGVVTGVYDLGAVVGSLACISYSEKIGRLRTISVGLILAIVGLAIESSAYSLAQFIIGRVVVGASIGTISASVPVWQSECSSSAHRGSFVIIEGLAISAGITLSEWVSFGFFFATKGSANWRVPLVFPVVFALFVLPMSTFMPESPRWLARKGRLDEARQALAALEDQDEHSDHINKEIAEIQLSLSEVRGSLKELTKNGKERVLNRTLLAMCAQMFQQMCGISALIFYTSTVFTNLGFHGTTSRILAACLTTFQTCCSVIPIFTIDRFGRRKLFMFSAAGMSVCMAVVAGTASSKNSGVAGVAVAFIYLYDFFFPIGFLGQTFLYATEVAPLKLRIPITAIANATQWMCQFIVAQVTPAGTTNLGAKYYIIYAVINAAAVPIVFFLFPETNGRSLEQMDHIFEQSQRCFDVVKVAKRLPRGAGSDAEQQLAGQAYPSDEWKPVQAQEEMVKQG